MGAVDALREKVAIALPASDVANASGSSASRASSSAGISSGCTDEGRAMPMTDVRRSPTRRADCRPRNTSPVLGEANVTPPVVQPASDTLRVLALGPLQVFVGGEAIDTTVWGSARPRALLVYMLMHPDGRTKEQVGLAFWPEASQAQLRNSFHVTLHRLRKAIRNPDWITLSNERYRVDPEVIAEFDVAEFERRSRRRVARSSVARTGLRLRSSVR
jgi:hypothetical protein